MTLFRSRWSPHPRRVSEADARFTRTLAGMGAPPTADPGVLDPATTEDQVLNPQGPGPWQGADLAPWLFPPRNWENIDQLSYVALPAIGSTATILTFTVPAGRNGVINKVACNFVGGGWTAGTGDVIWRILIDGAPPPGATSYDSIVDSLGSPALPVKISGFRIFENQVVTVVILNNPAGANGGVVVAGQRAGARLLGYLYPRDLEIEDVWI